MEGRVLEALKDLSNDLGFLFVSHQASSGNVITQDLFHEAAEAELKSVLALQMRRGSAPRKKKPLRIYTFGWVRGTFNFVRVKKGAARSRAGAVDEKSQIQALNRTQPVLPMGLMFVQSSLR